MRADQRPFWLPQRVELGAWGGIGKPVRPVGNRETVFVPCLYVVVCGCWCWWWDGECVAA
jgi:hypothetical protein